MMARETTSNTQKRFPPLSGSAEVVPLEPCELEVNVTPSPIPPILTRNGGQKLRDVLRIPVVLSRRSSRKAI